MGEHLVGQDARVCSKSVRGQPLAESAEYETEQEDSRKSPGNTLCIKAEKLKQGGALLTLLNLNQVDGDGRHL